jgi:radical SAM protein with 4Fe4S-binding SPASM domain
MLGVCKLVGHWPRSPWSVALSLDFQGDSRLSDQTPCNSFRGIPYSTFEDRIWPRVSAERTPLEGSIELTFRCNLRCAHCYVNEPSGDRRVKQQELTTAEILRITDEIVDLGCLGMLLTGGEPLLRPDFAKIYLHMKKKGLLAVVFTNGTLITHRTADLFEEWPPLKMEITIGGSTPAVYERVTGVPGSYRRCIQGIELLLDRKVRLCLKTVPMTLNYSDVDRMRALAASYGLEFRWDPLVNCRVDGSPGPVAVRLRPEQIVALDRQEPKRVAELRKGIAKSRLVEPTSAFFNCNAYRNSFHIDPYGDLIPCMLVRWPAYSLREGSFRQGWTEVFPAMRNRARMKALPCDTCQMNAACDHCVGWAQIETGDPESMVPFLCDLTYARAKAFAPVALAPAE